MEAVSKKRVSMNYFLAKTEPATYSIGQLEADRKTIWDGVTNPQAVRAIREMQSGDKVFIYHSGGESSIVGLARVSAAGRPDPKNPKSAVADLEFEARLDSPVTLAEIKQSHLFDEWALVRQSRLSTMQVPASFVSWMRKRFPKAGI
jgi:predicted RNA-binding protein with PUA-like domain